MSEIRNVHTRLIPGRPALVVRLLQDLDAIWPEEIAPVPSPRGKRLYVAPPMIWKEIDRPGATRAFRVLEPGELQAEHWFEVARVCGGALVRHVVEGRVCGSYESAWQTRIEPLHDRILEALLENLERAVTADERA